jgi:hypothetical protein
MFVYVGDAGVVRRPTVDMFTDITTKACIDAGFTEGTGFWVQFAVNLTDAEQVAIKRRCLTGSPNEEALTGRAEQGMDTLRTYIATPAPTAAQTAAAVKLLCQVAVTLTRFALRRFDGVD